MPGPASLLTRSRPSSARVGRARYLYTTFLTYRSLFYYLTVVPEKDAAAFEQTFERIVESIRLTEAR